MTFSWKASPRILHPRRLLGAEVPPSPPPPEEPGGGGGGLVSDCPVLSPEVWGGLTPHSSALSPQRRIPAEQPPGRAFRGMNFQGVPSGCRGAHSHAKRSASAEVRARPGRRRAGAGAGPLQSAPLGVGSGRGGARRRSAGSVLRAAPLPPQSHNRQLGTLSMPSLGVDPPRGPTRRP